MHYFHNLSSASGGFAPDPHRAPSLGPCWGTFIPRPPICPPPEIMLRRPCELSQLRLGVYAQSFTINILPVHYTPIMPRITEELRTAVTDICNSACSP